MSLVISCDLRSVFGEIRNQGNRPTCVSFAVSDAHAAVRDTYRALSVEHLYYHAVQRTFGCHPNDGVSFAKILEALRIDGQAAEGRWPYLDIVPHNLAEWVPPATAKPVFKRESAITNAAAGAITDHLNVGVPVVITFMASLGFCTVENGIVLPRISDTDIGWHAIIAVGHGQIDSKPLILIRNSWGNTWGLGGYAWLDQDYLTPRLSSFATIAQTGNSQ